jgi:Uma2 family endonuclease
MAIELQKRLFTTDEYHRLIEVGILSEDDRVELIEGEIIEMPAAGPDHAACVARLTILFTELLGRKVITWVQSPLHLHERNEPEPDVALLRPREDFYAGGLPTPDDTLLVVEVSESTLARDLKVKLPLYARAGIPEVWIISLRAKTVEAYSSPGDGAYKQTRRAKHGEALNIPGFPDMRINIDDILG